MIFKTTRLYLRPVILEDATSYENNFVDYEVIRYLSHHVPWPYPKGGVKSYLEKVILPDQGVNRWLWVIFEKDHLDEVIGAVELWRDGKPEHRGFWLSKKHWGKGYMSEAVEPVMDYAFNELGFKELIFANAVGNIGSRRVKEKTGASLLRVEPSQFVDPSFTEHEIWRLKKEDWIERKIKKTK